MKTMMLCDRLSGKETCDDRDLLEEELFGRWFVKFPDAMTTDKVSLNQFVIHSGVYLLHDRHGTWELRNDGLEMKGKMLLAGIPDDDMVVNFAAIAEDMNDLEWEKLITLSPLLRNLEDQINLTQSEQYLEKRFPHLKRICREPEAHLTQEIVKMPVSRSRKVSSKAINYLAAHSEDWLHRSFFRVIPKHILSEVKDDLWIIYENCVTAELIDRLLDTLKKRLKKLRGIEKFIDTLSEILFQLSEGNRYSRDRLYHLCGKAYQQNILSNQGNKLGETIQQLQQWQDRILPLTISKLYKRIPAHKKFGLGSSLKKTNLFTYHQHYKNVRLLWESLKITIKPDRDIFEERSRLIHSFNRYALLIVLRALNDLKFSSEYGGADSQSNIAIPVTSSIFGDLMVSFIEDETIVLQQATPLFQQTLHFIPLCCDINAIEPPERFQSLINSIIENRSHAANEVCNILYFEGTDNSAENPLYPIYENSISQSIGWIPIGPMDVYSIERVSRSILSWLLHSMCLLYPPQIDISAFPNELRAEISQLSTHGVCALNKNILFLREPLTKDNQNLLEDVLTPITKRNRVKIKNLEELREKLGSNKKIRDDVRIEGDKAERSEELISQFRNNMETASSQISQLCFCPVCLTEPRMIEYWEARDKDCFEFHCPNLQCQAIWGKRLCPDGHNILYLRIDNLENILLYQDIASCNDYIRVLGRDFLAEPKLQEDGKILWRCPDCGKLV